MPVFKVIEFCTHHKYNYFNLYFLFLSSCEWAEDDVNMHWNIYILIKYLLSAKVIFILYIFKFIQESKFIWNDFLYCICFYRNFLSPSFKNPWCVLFYPGNPSFQLSSLIHSVYTKAFFFIFCKWAIIIL